MDRYSDRDDYYDSDFNRGRYGRGEPRRRNDEEGYGRRAMSGRDYSTSGRYMDRDDMDRFEDYGTSRYPDRERDYNMGGYGGGRHTDEFFMRGEYTGRGPEGGGYGYGPSDDYERTGYGRRDIDRGNMNRGYSDRDFDSERYNWNGGNQSRETGDRWTDRPGQSARAGAFGYGNPEGWSSGPHAGRGPKGYERTTDRIREDVCERLTHHGRIDASDIEVKVENGEITLTGTVESREAKRMAEDVAESVGGVRDVHNQLRISRTTSNRSMEQRPSEQENANGQTSGRGPSRKASQP